MFSAKARRKEKCQKRNVMGNKTDIVKLSCKNKSVFLFVCFVLFCLFVVVVFVTLIKLRENASLMNIIKEAFPPNTI